MPTTVDDLSNSLQRFFAERFPLGGDGGAGSVLLVFDPLGFPLVPAEFIGTGDGNIGDLLAHQRAALLADQIPAANALSAGTYLPRGGSGLSRWYHDAVHGSSGPPVSDADGRAAFESAKFAALNAMTNSEVVLVTRPDGSPLPAGINVRYYATSMVPVDWFKEDSTAWQSYSVAAADDPPPQDESPWFVPLPPIKIREIPPPPPDDGGFLWREEIPPHLRHRYVSVPRALGNYVRLATHAERRTEFELQSEPGPWATEAIGVSPTLEHVHSGGYAVGHPQVALEISPLTEDASGTRTRLLNAVIEARLPTGELGDVDIPSEIARESPLVAWDPAVLEVAGGISVADAVISGTTERAPSSKNFSVRFDYCLVRFDRPWWDDVFLSRRDWKIPGYDAGQLSSGTATHPKDPLTMLTVGMLVIRDLTISANWSESDLASLPRSTSLGPFCIAAAAFDSVSGTLTRKGHQVIAWLCQVPPSLPPQ